MRLVWFGSVGLVDDLADLRGARTYVVGMDLLSWIDLLSRIDLD